MSDRTDQEHILDSDDEGYRIIIDGTARFVRDDEVTFDQVVLWAYPDGGRGPLITYTVTFYDGGGDPAEGALTEGEKVKVKNGTAFNVTRTDRS